jgi:hypothetical protein
MLTVNEKRVKGEHLDTVFSLCIHESNVLTLPVYVDMQLPINAKVLVDTGSSRANYITRRLAELLINQGADVQECNAIVSSGIRGSLEQKVRP